MHPNPALPHKVGAEVLDPEVVDPFGAGGKGDAGDQHPLTRGCTGVRLSVSI